MKFIKIQREKKSQNEQNHANSVETYLTNSLIKE
jgi:hypothetical protein